MHEIHGMDQDGPHCKYSGVGSREDSTDGSRLIRPRECPAPACAWCAWLWAAASLYVGYGKQC